MSANSADSFDPYHKWLGIPRDQRPVTHYQLLNISPEETDLEVIEETAIRQSTHVRTYQLGPHSEACQRLLSQIAQARQVLLNPEKRKEYDATLAKPIAKPTRAKPQTVALEPKIKTPTRKPAAFSSRGMIGALVAGGAALAAAAVGGAIWLSQPEAPVKKVTPSFPPKSLVAASAEPNKHPAIAEPKRAPEPKHSPEKTPSATKSAEGIAVQEYDWRRGMERTQTLLRRNEGIVVFAGATAPFGGFGEFFNVCIDRDGDWNLEARAVVDMQGYASAVTRLPVGLFDLDRTTTAYWSHHRGNPNQLPRELCSESDGICWINGIGGLFGGGERVRVYVEDGKWLLDGMSGGGDMEGEAVICRFAKGADRTKLRISEVEWHADGEPLKLLDVKDGFCAITDLGGDLRSGGQRVQLTTRDGAWWLYGRDSRSNLVVRVLRVSTTGILPTIPGDKVRILPKGDASSPPDDPKIEAGKSGGGLSVREWEWHNGSPRTQTLVRRGNGGSGIAVFSGVSGVLGWGEKLTVGVNKAGEWFFEGRGLSKASGAACRVTGLPDGFFDVDKTTMIAVSPTADHRDEEPRELCLEEEGICWIAGMGGRFGGDERLKVYREDGKWWVRCTSGGSDCSAEAVACRFGTGVDRTKLRLSEVEWRPKDGPIRLLDVKDGFCALVEMYGPLDDENQEVRLSVKEGAWRLDGVGERGNVMARVLRVSLTGNLPEVIREKEAAVAKIAAPDAAPRKGLARPDRLSAPDATAQAVALKKLHGLAKTPGLKATAKEWTSHTTFVFGLGKETKDDLDLRFVALREAFELTYPLGDSETAERALSMLDEEYAIDPIGLKTAALIRAYSKPPVASSHRILAERCDDVAREALAAEDFDRAGKVAALGLSNAVLTKIPAITTHATKRLTQVRDFAKAFEVCKTATNELRTNPDDPKACATAGSFLALAGGDWDAGLKLLAKGSDEKLQALAKKDLSQPTDIDVRRSLCEAWADLVDREQPAYKIQAAVRAFHWYRLLDGAVVGLDRLKLDKRLAEIAKYLPAPLPTARWTFDGNARDALGELHGQNAAKLKFVQGRLQLGNRQDMLVPLPFDVRERTLEVWVYLPTPERRAGIIQIRKIVDSVNGWDGIIFSINSGRLYPGSSHEQRSRELDIPVETSQPSDLLHLAIVYASDHTVTMYRNGKLLSPPFHNDLSKPETHIRTYRKGESEIRFGGEMALDFEEARLYTRALSADEIAMSYLTFKK